MSRVAAAVFVKTPGRSAVKTRLARSLGRDEAEALYRDSLDCIRGAIDGSRCARYWAVAEPDAVDHTPWTDAPCVAQPAGDLGDRMAGVFRRLRRTHPAVLLLGGDLPQLAPAELDRAADWLRTPGRHVLGPARDGGFWLYGSSAEDPTAGWPGLPYSRPETAARFRTAIAAPEDAWLELPLMSDLDDRGDLDRVADELDRLETPSTAQRALAAKLRAVMTQSPTSNAAERE